MIDTQTEALLAAVRDALAVPEPADPEARTAHLELARDRAAAVRYSVDHALATGDIEHATDLIDGAIADLPATYPTDPVWSSNGVTA